MRWRCTAPSLSIDIRTGALEQAERSESIEIGLRVLMGRRQACVSASDISAATIPALAERAVAMAREAPEDPHAGLADPAQLAHRLGPGRAGPGRSRARTGGRRCWRQQPARSRLRRWRDGHHAGRGRRPAIAAASCTWPRRTGFPAAMAAPRPRCPAVAFTGQGTEMERDYAGESRIYAADMPDAGGIGRACRRTHACSGWARSSRAPATYPVLYDERVASSLIGHLLSAINGSSIARGVKLGARPAGQAGPARRACR